MADVNEVIQKFGEKDFKKGATILDEAKPESTGFPDFQSPFNALICYYAIFMAVGLASEIVSEAK